MTYFQSQISPEILSGYLMLASWLATPVNIVNIHEYDIKMLVEILSDYLMLANHLGLPVNIMNIYEYNIKMLAKKKILSG